MCANLLFSVRQNVYYLRAVEDSQSACTRRQGRAQDARVRRSGVGSAAEVVSVWRIGSLEDYGTRGGAAVSGLWRVAEPARGAGRGTGPEDPLRARDGK